MNVMKIEPSTEPCAEAGFYGYDFFLENEIGDEFINSLRPLGSLMYLPMLKKPFFKVESDYYLLKGLKSDSFFRMAVHGDYLHEIDRIKGFVESLP
nr:hypothetical protein [uncultured Sphaerochaeta sp.]